MRALNNVVDGGFAARMVRNIRNDWDSEDYAAELAKIDEQLVGLQKEPMAIARMIIRIEAMSDLEKCLHPDDDLDPLIRIG